jgi:hypothetical protein
MATIDNLGMRALLIRKLALRAKKDGQAHNPHAEAFLSRAAAGGIDYPTDRQLVYAAFLAEGLSGEPGVEEPAFVRSVEVPQ